jgi:hypothetical protein
MVVARTYNEAPDGTFGQGMPGNPDSEALTFGQLGVLPQLKKTSVFRTNVGFMNHGSADCSVRVRLYSENGTQIGNAIDTSVPAMQWKQINDVFGEAGVGQCPIGYATVEVRTAGGMVWAYGSVVDNHRDRRRFRCSSSSTNCGANRSRGFGPRLFWRTPIEIRRRPRRPMATTHEADASPTLQDASGCASRERLSPPAFLRVVLMTIIART